MQQITVNGESRDVASEPDTPLLWVLRDELGLTGTKYGCGIAACGACTVHVDGHSMRSCVLPLERVTGEVTTIEGLAEETPSGRSLHVVQRAWIEHQVAQCGYCQSGQIMTAVALLAADPRPSDETIDRAFAGNLCRCGTYPRIRAAVHAAADALASAAPLSGPVPSEPVSSKPLPSEPLPNEPLPSEPLPNEPSPNEPSPSELLPSEASPSGARPSAGQEG